MASNMKWLVFSGILCFTLVTGDSDTCPPLPKIMNAYAANAESDNYPIYSLVHYSCMIGYYKEGDGRVRCTLNALNQLAWTTPTFTCVPVICGPPDAPANGWIRGSTFSFGHTIEYNCRSGFELYSPDGESPLPRSPVRQCLANGDWSGEEPQCKAILCNEPEMPDNGIALFETLDFGAKLKYKCHYGYELVGDSERWCKDDGQWSGEEPSCKAIPDEVICKIPQNVYLGRHYLLPGPSLQYECRDGSKKVSYCDNGQWHPPVPDCDRAPPDDSTCRIPENVPLGRHYLFRGRRLQYECKDGTTKYSDCHNGKWNPPVSDCEKETVPEEEEVELVPETTETPEESLPWYKRAARKVKNWWNGLWYGR